MNTHEDYSIEKDGFSYIEITEHFSVDSSKTTDSGDAFILTPDGSHISVSWLVLEDDPYVETIYDESKQKDPFMTLGFVKPITTLEDLIFNFHAVLPLVKEEYEKIRKKKNVQ